MRLQVRRFLSCNSEDPFDLVVEQFQISVNTDGGIEVSFRVFSSSYPLPLLPPPLCTPHIRCSQHTRKLNPLRPYRFVQVMSPIRRLLVAETLVCVFEALTGGL